MLGKLLGFSVVFWFADIYPITEQRKAHHIIIFADELLYQIVGAKMGVFGNMAYVFFSDEVYSCVGIVCVLGLLADAGDLVFVHLKNAVWDGMGVRDGGDRHIGVGLFEMEIEVLKVDIRKEVGVHDEYRGVMELSDIAYGTHGALVFWLSDTAYLNSVARLFEMVFDLFGEVVGGDIDMFYAVADECVNVTVDNGFVPYF